MNFKVDQQALLAELSLAMGAVETRQTMPMAGLIHFKIVKGNLILTAMNVDTAIRSRVRVQAEGDASFVLPAARLHDWLSKAPAGEMSCSVNKRFSAKVGKSNSSIAFPNAVVFPEMPPVGKAVATMDSVVIGQMLRRVSSVVPNTDNSQYSYSGVNLVITKDLLRIDGTDGRRMALTRHTGQFDIGKEKVSVLVAKKFALEAVRLSSRSKDEAVRIYVGDNHVYFNFGDRLIYSRALGGRFPDLARAVPDAAKQSVAEFDSQEAAESLQRVAAFSDRDSRAVDFHLNGQLKLSSTSEFGDGSEEIPAKYSGDMTVVKINSSWVLDFLKAIDGPAEMRITSAAAPVEFRAAGDVNFQYILAPMYKK